MNIQPLAMEKDESTGVVTVRIGMPDQSVVVLDHALIQRLDRTLADMDQMVGITGMILASTSEKVFIAGADLKAISGLTDEQLDRYLEYGQRVFGMLCELPFPTAAAINGAALGGGLEVAMHCDGLIGAPSASGKPYPVGLPEAGLSICPGWGGTNLLPARMDAAEAIRRTAEGKPMTFDEAVKAGFFDTVASSPAELLATAKAWLLGQRNQIGRRDGAPRRWIGRPSTAAKAAAAMFQVEETLPRTAAAEAVIGAVRAGLDRGWKAALESERRSLVRLRGTAEGKAAIKAFFEKSAAPKR